MKVSDPAGGREAVPFSAGEAEGAARTQDMDPYHKWLLLEAAKLIRRLQAENDELTRLFGDRVLDSDLAFEAQRREREACARVAESLEPVLRANERQCHDIAEAIRARGGVRA